MVDLKTDATPTPKKTKHVLSMSTVKNWFVNDKKNNQEQPANNNNNNFRKMPETFLRSLRRRSLRVKRTKSLVLPEKRKSGMCTLYLFKIHFSYRRQLVRTH